jgi:hypothetical protein
MSKTLASDIFAVGLGGPELHAGAADPSAGGGVVAPTGSIYFRTNGTWWRKTAAGNTAWVEDIGAAMAEFVYTASGVEGSAFDVTIPAPFTPLPAATYYPAYVLESVTDHVTMSFPTAGGDRTTLKFSVVTSANLTAGDTIRFTLFTTA